MDNPRPEKVALVAEIRARLEGSASALLTEYRGLRVAEMAGLRHSLRNLSCDYKVYKNTLVRRAAADAGLADLLPLLEGPTAIAFVNGDAAEVAKLLRDFAKTSPGLVVKGGLLGSSTLGAAEASSLADLPSKQVMLARVAGALAAPMRQMAGLLQALPASFAYGLQALIDERSKGAAGGPPA